MRKEIWTPPIPEVMEVPIDTRGLIVKAYRRLMKSGTEYQKFNFKTSQFLYDQNLTAIKKLIAQLPDEKDRMVYERNCMRDISHFETIWQFCSPNFSFNHHVTIKEECLIYYSFHHCSIKDEIMHIIRRYKMDNYYQEVQRQDLNAYFKMMVTDHPKYVTVL